MNYFDKKIIWITGASSGIGRELAIQLSNYDCTLILTARRKEQLEDTKLKCGNANVQVYPFDLNLYNQRNENKLLFHCAKQEQLLQIIDCYQHNDLID